MIARVYDGRTGEWTEQPVPEVVHDDITRTVTTTSPDGQVTTRDYTPAENRSADAAIADAATLTDLAERVARIEAHLWPPDPTPGTTARTWAGHGGVWPHGTLLDDGGTIWRNTAKVPLTTPPRGFPGGGAAFGHLFVEVKTAPNEPSEPGEWPAWEPWDHVRPLYQVGAQVTHNGQRWVATVGNNHWTPGVYGWTDLGPT